jgi:hypothetical protein
MQRGFLNDEGAKAGESNEENAGPTAGKRPMRNKKKNTRTTGPDWTK